MGTCGRNQIVGFLTKSSHSKNYFACSRYYRAQHNVKDDGNEKITTERKTHSVFGTGFFACLPRPSTTKLSDLIEMAMRSPRLRFRRKYQYRGSAVLFFFRFMGMHCAYNDSKSQRFKATEVVKLNTLR